MYTSSSSLRGVDCDTDHYLVFAECRERLSARKRKTKKFGVEWFKLGDLNYVEIKEE
jgi:hypothetical protein